MRLVSSYVPFPQPQEAAPINHKTKIQNKKYYIIRHSNINYKSSQKMDNATTKPITGADTAALLSGRSPSNLSMMLDFITPPERPSPIGMSRTDKRPPLKVLFLFFFVPSLLLFNWPLLCQWQRNEGPKGQNEENEGPKAQNVRSQGMTCHGGPGTNPGHTTPGHPGTRSRGPPRDTPGHAPGTPRDNLYLCRAGGPGLDPGQRPKKRTKIQPIGIERCQEHTKRQQARRT